MSKRVIIVHCWDGKPQESWYPWVKKELEQRDYEVVIPEMPNTSTPKIIDWVSFLGQIIGKPDMDLILIGHSIGCQTILRYLENLPKDENVGKVIFVAGWMDLLPVTYGDEEEKEIARPWVESSIDLEKVKGKAGSFTAIFSDDDPYVDFKENSRVFKDKLQAKIVIESGKGHFDEVAGIKQFPELLKYI